VGHMNSYNQMNSCHYHYCVMLSAPFFDGGNRCHGS
jgi:hypothetical protein